MHYYGTRLSVNISRRFRNLSRRDCLAWAAARSPLRKSHWLFLRAF